MTVHYRTGADNAASTAAAALDGAFADLLQDSREQSTETGVSAPKPKSVQKKGFAMAICDLCGNDYDKAFQISQGGKTLTFDSFECAIHAMAPRCAHCHCAVVGHGVEASGVIYCCAHCAHDHGVKGVSDRAA